MKLTIMNYQSIPIIPLIRSFAVDLLRRLSANGVTGSRKRAKLAANANKADANKPKALLQRLKLAIRSYSKADRKKALKEIQAHRLIKDTPIAGKIKKLETEELPRSKRVILEHQLVQSIQKQVGSDDKMNPEEKEEVNKVLRNWKVQVSVEAAEAYMAVPEGPQSTDVRNELTKEFVDSGFVSRTAFQEKLKGGSQVSLKAGRLEEAPTTQESPAQSARSTTAIEEKSDATYLEILRPNDEGYMSVKTDTYRDPSEMDNADTYLEVNVGPSLEDIKSGYLSVEPENERDGQYQELEKTESGQYREPENIYETEADMDKARAELLFDQAKRAVHRNIAEVDAKEKELTREDYGDLSQMPQAEADKIFQNTIMNRAKAFNTLRADRSLEKIRQSGELPVSDQQLTNLEVIVALNAAREPGFGEKEEISQEIHNALTNPEGYRKKNSIPQETPSTKVAAPTKGKAQGAEAQKQVTWGKNETIKFQTEKDLELGPGDPDFLPTAQIPEDGEYIDPTTLQSSKRGEDGGYMTLGKSEDIYQEPPFSSGDGVYQEPDIIGGPEDGNYDDLPGATRNDKGYVKVRTESPYKEPENDPRESVFGKLGGSTRIYEEMGDPTTGGPKSPPLPRNHPTFGKTEDKAGKVKFGTGNPDFLPTAQIPEDGGYIDPTTLQSSNRGEDGGYMTLGKSEDIYQEPPFSSGDGVYQEPDIIGGPEDGNYDDLPGATRNDKGYVKVRTESPYKEPENDPRESVFGKLGGSTRIYEEMGDPTTGGPKSPPLPGNHPTFGKTEDKAGKEKFGPGNPKFFPTAQIPEDGGYIDPTTLQSSNRGEDGGYMTLGKSEDIYQEPPFSSGDGVYQDLGIIGDPEDGNYDDLPGATRNDKGYVKVRTESPYKEPENDPRESVFGKLGGSTRIYEEMGDPTTGGAKSPPLPGHHPTFGKTEDKAGKTKLGPGDPDFLPNGRKVAEDGGYIDPVTLKGSEKGEDGGYMTLGKPADIYQEPQFDSGDGVYQEPDTMRDPEDGNYSEPLFTAESPSKPKKTNGLKRPKINWPNWIGNRFKGVKISKPKAPGWSLKWPFSKRNRDQSSVEKVKLPSNASEANSLEEFDNSAWGEGPQDEVPNHEIEPGFQNPTYGWNPAPPQSPSSPAGAKNKQAKEPAVYESISDPIVVKDAKKTPSWHQLGDIKGLKRQREDRESDLGWISPNPIETEGPLDNPMYGNYGKEPRQAPKRQKTATPATPVTPKEFKIPHPSTSKILNPQVQNTQPVQRFTSPIQSQPMPIFAAPLTTASTASDTSSPAQSIQTTSPKNTTQNTPSVPQIPTTTPKRAIPGTEAAGIGSGVEIGEGKIIPYIKILQALSNLDLDPEDLPEGMEETLKEDIKKLLAILNALKEGDEESLLKREVSEFVTVENLPLTIKLRAILTKDHDEDSKEAVLADTLRRINKESKFTIKEQSLHFQTKKAKDPSRLDALIKGSKAKNLKEFLENLQ